MDIYKPVNRIIKILEKLSMGQELTSGELYREFEGKVSLRTIQRDFMTIQDAGIPLLASKNENKENVWYFPRDYRRMLIPSIQKNELISIYILKSFLNEFKGTRIESHLKTVIDKLENMAPGEVYMEIGGEEDFVWSQDFGNYDYSQFDQILNQLILSIIEKKWLCINYKGRGYKVAKKIKAFPYRLFTYNGILYLACYVEYHDNIISLVLQRMVSVEYLSESSENPPAFNLQEFKKNRFGVFGGESKEIILQINPEYVIYFSNRSWHPSQEVKYKEDGSMVLKIEAPLTPELETWILGWHEAIKVIAPKELISRILNKTEQVRNLYK